MVRRWLDRLGRAPARRRPDAGASLAWLVALRNLTRLVVPAVARGCSSPPSTAPGCSRAPTTGRFFALPPFVLVLIGAGWLAGSLLAPQAPRLPAWCRSTTTRRTPAHAAGAAPRRRAVARRYLVAGLSLRWDALHHHPVGAAVPAGAARRARPLAGRRAGSTRRARRHRPTARDSADRDDRGGGCSAADRRAVLRRRRGRRAAARRRRLPAGGGLPGLPQRR